MTKKRTIAKRQRYAAAFHEAGHLVAGYLFGLDIVRAELMPVAAMIRRRDRERAEWLGCVYFTHADISDVHSAEDRIVVGLAGEATTRVAWALDLLDDVELGDRTPTKPLTVDESLVVPNGASTIESAAYYGWLDNRSEPDEVAAARLVEAFTSTPLESACLMAWCRSRTTSMVATDRFQVLAGIIAAVLLEHGEVSGELAVHLLERADEVRQPTEGNKR